MQRTTLGWNSVPATRLAMQPSSDCPAKTFARALSSWDVGCKQAVQTGDFEQVMDLLVQIDEFEFAATLSRRSPYADEGSDADTIDQAHLAQIHKDRLALRNQRADRH